MPLATIVIPTRNRLPLLQEAVRSVERQRLADWELVIVDDASEDGTGEWAAGLRDPRVRVLRLEEHGERAAARNLGLEEARGRWVLFLDDDDRLRPDALARLVGAVRAEPGAVAAVGAIEVFDDRGHKKRLPHPRWPLTRDVWMEVLAGWVGIPGQSLFETARLRAAGGWHRDLIVAEDQELWLRMARLGPVAFVPAVVLEYRVHGGQWYAADHRELAEAMREECVRALPDAVRDVGRRVLEARRWGTLGAEASARGESLEALRCFLRAMRAAPELLASPLTGLPLAGAVGKALAGLCLGRRGQGAVRRAKAALRRALRRDPGVAANPEVRPVAGKFGSRSDGS